MNKTILVIEDEEEIRKDIAKALQLYKYNTIDAASGTIGVKLAKDHKPDLIISDIMMPGLDGYGVLRELQNDPETAAIPFLFLSARSAKADVREGMKLGADDYITKPYDIDELIGAVETRLKKVETSEIKYNKKFEELRSSIRRSMPHEIRTPLNIILGFSEFLKKNYERTSAADAKEMLSNIFEAGNRLNRLFENYLFYANLEIILTNADDIAKYRKKRTTLVEYIIRDLSSYHAGSSGRANDLIIELEDATISISEEHIAKIVDEIIGNSLKFSDRGTPIKVISKIEKSYYIISFTDYGRGMTKDQIESLGAYIQFERKIYEQQGTGLGLAIVKRIVELHGGEFEIISEPNAFTTVIVKLPLYKV